MIKKCSSYKRIIRIVADGQGLHVVPRINAGSKVTGWKLENCIWTLDMYIEFRGDIANLEQSSTWKPNYIQRLNPFILNASNDGISTTLLRVSGCLSKAPLPYDFKYPLLLRKNYWFIKLYFMELHRTNCHAGPRVLVVIPRERIWAINARHLARRTINSVVMFQI